MRTEGQAARIVRQQRPAGRSAWRFLAELGLCVQCGKKKQQPLDCGSVFLCYRHLLKARARYQKKTNGAHGGRPRIGKPC